LRPQSCFEGVFVAQDLYAELGVSRGASADEIRKSFRKLAKELHPDRNPGDKAAEERFKKVSAAFDILGDPEKKKKYDKGEIDADGRETARAYGGGRGPWGGGGGPWGGSGSSGPWGQAQSGGSNARFEDHDFEDILGEVFGARGFKRGGGGGFSSRGADVRATLEIDLEDAINGGVKRIAFGDGRTLDVTIPKGAAEGQTLRLKGQGQPGRGQAQAGDALIERVNRPHPIYRREGANLHMDLPVSVPDAVLGAKVQAPTPDGVVSLTVPKGSNSGSVMRLKGRGATDGPGGKRGDLFARLIVTLPDAPDPELERFAERWREERPYTPRRRG
jgi:DnaJ-class molecular chaperone